MNIVQPLTFGQTRTYHLQQLEKHHTFYRSEDNLKNVFDLFLIERGQRKGQIVMLFVKEKFVKGRFVLASKIQQQKILTSFKQVNIAEKN